MIAMKLFIHSFPCQLSMSTKGVIGVEQIDRSAEGSSELSKYERFSRGKGGKVAVKQGR